MKRQTIQKPREKSMLVCPWWFCFAFDNPLRRLVQNPEKILKPYVKKGWTVLDVGPGMGYFTIPLARLVGDKGRVIAADIQPKMLESGRRRAMKAGVEQRIDFHLSQAYRIGISKTVDFTLLFWMAHEVPDRARFLYEIASMTRPGRLLLIVEPWLHVNLENFNDTVAFAVAAGFEVIERPKVFFSYAVLMRKKAPA
jgi:ubiquinone/menaquinone biosynthesis C-methylase UbiE